MGKKERPVDHDRRQKDPARLSPTAWGVIVAVIGTIVVAGVIAALVLPNYDLVMTSQYALLTNLFAGIMIVTITGILICVLRSVDCLDGRVRLLTRRVDAIADSPVDHLRIESLGDIPLDTDPKNVIEVATETAPDPMEVALQTAEVTPRVMAATIAETAEVATAEMAEATVKGIDLGDTQEIIIPEQSIGEQERVVVPHPAVFTADTAEIDTERVRELSRKGNKAFLDEESSPLGDDRNAASPNMERNTTPLDEDDSNTLDAIALNELDRGSNTSSQKMALNGLDPDDLARLRYLLFQTGILKDDTDEASEANEEVPAGEAQPIELAQLASTPQVTEDQSIDEQPIEVAQIADDQLSAEDEHADYNQPSAEEDRADPGNLIDIQAWYETSEGRRARLAAEIQEHNLSVTVENLDMILNMANCNSYTALPESYKDILRNQPNQGSGTTQDNMVQWA